MREKLTDIYEGFTHLFEEHPIRGVQNMAQVTACMIALRDLITELPDEDGENT